jgi:hypothetical protein
VMAARPVRFAFTASAGAGRLHGCQFSFSHDVEIRFPACISGLTQAVCLGPHTIRSWTCRAMRRLVVRGGDLSKMQQFGQGPETQRQVESALLLDVAIDKGTTILKLLASSQRSSPRG